MAATQASGRTIMKRLALLASIALALSTLGVGPAAATSLDTVPALTTQEDSQPRAEDTGNAADAGSPGTDEAGGADEASTDGPGTDEADGSKDPGADSGKDGDEADGNASSDPDENTPPGDETADPDESEGASEDGAEDGSEDSTEEADPIEATFSLAETQMTADEIGAPDRGIRYTIDSLKAGDVVTAEPGEDTSTTVEKDGTFSGAILGNTELKTGDTLDISVTVEREGQEPKTFTGSVEVVAPDGDGDEVPSAELTVSPKTQGLHEFINNGVDITLVNCVMDEEVTFRVSTKADPDTTIWEDSQMAGEDAAGFSTFIPEGDGGTGWVGDYLVMASCGDQSAETIFTVTDDGSVVDPKLSVDPEKLSGEDFVDRDKGVTMTVSDCRPGTDVQFEVWGHEPSEKLYDRTVEVNANGAASVQVYGIENSPDAYVGTYKVTAICMEQSMQSEFVVTGSGSGSSGGGADESDDSDGSGNAGSMPRTGAELTGLGAGAALILAGAATIIFARRRAQLGS